MSRRLQSSVSGGRQATEKASVSMEPYAEILRLLAEIRDLQREHFAEYKRINEEALQLNRAAAESANAQYRVSLKSPQASTWGVFILSAVCVGANLFRLFHIAGGR